MVNRTVNTNEITNATTSTKRRVAAPYGQGAGRPVAALVAAALTFASASTYTAHAHAEEVSPTGKGIVGGALLGAEAVTITEGIIGVRKPIAYVIGGGLGAIGGGVAGYFIEQGSDDGRVPVYMLAGGMALVIPAVIVTLNATRYRPSEGATEDRVPPDAPVADPGIVGGSITFDSGASGGTGAPPANPTPPAAAPPVPAPSPTPQQAPPPQSLFDVHDGAFRIGVPLPEVRAMYTMAELKEYGVPQQTVVRMPMLRVTF
jgi:hypothetical protein